MADSRLLRWAHGHFDTYRPWRRKSHHAPSLTTFPSIPALPNPRPLTLTPSPSQESLCARTTRASGLFSRLPAHIRRLILIHAFGDRTIHLDLRLTSGPSSAEPVPRPASAAKGKAVHGFPAPRLAGPRGALRGLMARDPELRAKMVPGMWQWWSCVCHREEEAAVMKTDPAWDNCLIGLGVCTAEEGRTHETERCRIGALGWLLCCRQAYTEGIDVIFSTNTIFIESQPLFQALVRQTTSPSAPTALLPQRINLIRSLELRWALTLFDPHHESPAPSHRALLNEYVSLLPSTFPSLRRLRIDFEDWLYNEAGPPSLYMDRIDNELLKPLARMVRACAKLQNVIVCLPSNVFDAVCGDAPSTSVADAVSFAGETLVGTSIWYPFAADEKSRGRGSGYWIRIGEVSFLEFDENGDRKMYRQWAMS